MLKLSRKRTKGIPKAFRGDDRVTKTFELLKKEREIKCTPSLKHEFPSNWSPCKAQLLKESAGKCAYCESPTVVIAYGDVEHYRPKSKYWWLAYCYDNYLASCTLCNQKYKKAKFSILNNSIPAPVVSCNEKDESLWAKAERLIPDPYEGETGMSYSDYLSIHLAERPLLINPYLDDPNDFFKWEVDHLMNSVKLAPKNDTDSLHIKMVGASEQDYGINRKELCNHRYDVYLTYAQARLMSEDNQVPVYWREMQRNKRKQMLKPQSAYSGMLLYFETIPSQYLSLPADD